MGILRTVDHIVGGMMALAVIITCAYLFIKKV